MGDRKELKEQKKTYRKARRRATRPWKALTWISGPLAIVLTIVTIIAGMFDNTMAIFIGGTFWELEDADEDAQYFKPDFDTVDEIVAYGLEIAEQVEAEGATLLLNKNQALPLGKGAKVSLFSNSMVNPVYGGTGSGNIDASTALSFKDAFRESGIEVNETLWNFYLGEDMAQYERDGGGFTSSAAVGEVPWSVYTDEVKNSVTQYKDAAIVMFSRVGGEGVDLNFEENYLELNQDEKDLLAGLSGMKAAGDVEKIIVLLNTANTLEVDFLWEDAYDIDACLWIGDVGIKGTEAVTDMIAGLVTPSGSLADTYCKNNFTSPAMVNNIATMYEGADAPADGGTLVPSAASYYMVYQEGIYVGYRYYETRYEDHVMEKGHAGEYAYADDVAFPFGYGLSYTDFAYSDMQVTYNGETDQFEVTVTVTNVGDTYSGKETIQVYSQSPYTDYDKENGVEKASVTLCGFGKTDILAPGESETITVKVDKRDLASYDAYGAKTYILDEGDYYLTLATDAHNAVNNILAAKGYTPENTAERMDAPGDTRLVYKWTQDVFDAETYALSAKGTKITNQLEMADPNLYEGSGTKVTYLTRNNWVGTFPTENVKIALTDMLVSDLQNVQYDPDDYEQVEMPVMGADNDLKLYDMMGLAYDDPKWDKLLDQMTYDEMAKMVTDGFHWQMPVKSIEAPGTRDENGPQGLTASLMKTSDTKGTAFTSEDVMAATFNTELMYEVGKCIANDCLSAGVSFLYGTGANTHRTPYGGRNFEYYSEDGFLAGEICAAETLAMEERGVGVLMKHFALNDSEQQRIGLGVWVPEQAAREIYLKAYQAPVEDGNANGVMTAYTRWGALWSGANYNLITNILRNEWGCDGKIITDNALNEYLNVADFVLAGGSIFDAMLPTQQNQAKAYKDDPVIVSAIREACHRNLYKTVNGSAMNGVGEDTEIKLVNPTIVNVTRVITLVLWIAFAGSLAMWMRKRRQFKKSYRATKTEEN